MADFSKLNGYDVKDATARNGISEINEDIDIINSNISLNNNQRLTTVDMLRYKNSNNFHKISFPEQMDPFFNRLTIYESYDKKKYTAYIDEGYLKNSGGSTYYIDINAATDTGDGSQSNPFKTFTRMFSHTEDGDTVIVKKGIYTLSELPSSASGTPKQNINIICEDGVVIVQGTRLTWTQNETYSNVYQASRTTTALCIDLRKRDEKIFPKLTKKSSLVEVANSIYSYYFDSANNIVYVNLGEEVTNDKVAVTLNRNFCPFYVKPYGKNIKMYVENAIFITGAGGTPVFRVDATEDYTAELNCKNCMFLYGGDNGNVGAMSVGGAYTTFINCEASFNTYGDGFAYHTEGGRYSRGIEINCVGRYNGLESTSGNLQYANNGSTIHENSQIIRINGEYHNNKGCNVGDTGANAISLNYGCKAWDSEVNVEGHNRNADFGALGSTAKMYLYSCFAQGKSEMNIYSGESHNVVNVSNCLYNTTGGNGTINVIE